MSAPASTTSLRLWEEDLPVLSQSQKDPGADTAAKQEPDPAAAVAASEALLEQAREEANRLRSEAEKQAAEVLAEAEERVRAAEAQAREEAAKAVARQAEQTVRELVQVLQDDLAQGLRERWQELEREAGRLCIELAESILRRKIAEDDQIVVETVRAGLGRMSSARDITVRVSPEAEGVLERARESLRADLPASVSLTVIADEAISPGGALLTSSHGEMDLRLESQLARLKEAAQEALAQEVRP
jgi:flagellar assembly protein FliH